VADRVRVQPHPSGRLDMREERMVVKHEHHAGSLPKLILEYSLMNDLLAVGKKTRWKIGAIH
jgi:hypothetical protein